ncbi:MAG: ABC transporter ATP-binding protein [Methylocella sp.]
MNAPTATHIAARANPLRSEAAEQLTKEGARPLLRIEDFTLDFRIREGAVHALDSVSLDISRGEIVGMVGESGSGKSVLAYAIMGLTDAAGLVRSGRIEFSGRDMLRKTPARLSSMLGREISMVFQSPRTALNPIRRIGRQVEDVLLRHGNVSRRAAQAAAVEALRRVRIPDPERRFYAYPFELSGGLCQRVMIAMALACSPSLLIADEPTGLDVTTQAAVMDLIRDQVRALGASVLLITHNLALAGEYCDRIVVMHAGHLVEAAPAERLLRRAAHPYTARLMGATPAVGMRIEDLASVPEICPICGRRCLRVASCTAATASMRVAAPRRCRRRWWKTAISCAAGTRFERSAGDDWLG